ncbi:UvrD-helicase domain-containing protein [Psychromonas aquimarina]|uniref:UvrD-helicase domain-containing protein n=1 Tax=Psychromonas aquimarina TaxID=444919 RepID=UPI0004214FD6|nr:UvrD-helicase domain-containing protein [Psychromonas aquimarina]
MKQQTIAHSWVGRCVGQPAGLVISKQGIQFSQEQESLFFSWQEITRPPEFKLGWFGCSIRIKVAEQNYQVIQLAYRTQSQFRKRCTQYWITNNQPRLAAVITKIEQLTTASYLRHSLIKAVQRALRKESKRWFPWSDNHPQEQELNYLLDKMKFILSWQGADIEQLREAYLSKQLHKYQLFFDQVESNPLTAKQRRACITDDDNNLLLAGAGTGKTSVMVGRAGYLLNSGQAQAEDILLLAYGRQAADEMDQRIKDKLGITSIKTSTFHSLGLKIIAEVEGAPPRLSLFAQDEKAKSEWVEQCFNLLLEQPNYCSAALHYFSRYYYPEKSPFDFESLGGYLDYLNSNNICTIKGEKVKSFAELLIADWLFSRGIEYQYQRAYPDNVKDAAFSRYKPSFYLSELDVYIDYYATDKNGAAAPYINDTQYKASMQLQRAAHQKYQTVSIELFEAQQQSGELLEILQESLLGLNVQVNPLPDALIVQSLRESGRTAELAGLFAQLIALYKGSCLDALAEHKLLGASADGVQVSKALLLLKPLLGAYQSHLKNAGEIDFEDMICTALSYIKQGKFISPWPYIMVDEFQDISRPRAALVKALRDSLPGTSVFAVGDDWQAIYRFSGADVTLTTEFAGFFGKTTQNELDQTFRFNNSIGQVAADFVCRNPAQINKQIKSFTQVDKPAVSILRKGVAQSRSKQGKQVNELASGALEQVLDKLTEKVSVRGKTASVYLTARFWYQLPDKKALRQLNNKYSNLDIQTQSFHASKGKEADYSVIIGMSSGLHGFPSEKITPPLLDALLAKEQEFAHAEERRLFYVALTRAKHRVYIIADMNAASPFVSELIDGDYQVEVNEFAVPPAQLAVNEIRCRICAGGTLTARSGSFGTFYACSNFPRCEHKERACECGQSPMTRDRYPGFKVCLDKHCGFIFPLCEKCGGQMTLRTGKNGQFWGCKNYRGSEQPSCRHAVDIKEIVLPVV